VEPTLKLIIEDFGLDEINSGIAPEPMTATAEPAQNDGDAQTEKVQA
jgi:hypothetical protein